MTAAIVILSLIVVFLVVLIVLLKRDLRHVNGEFKTIMQSDTNKRLTSLTLDKDVCVLERNINDLLERQKQLKIGYEKMDKELKMAVTNISHDLRTPLTSAIGYLQMAKDESIAKEKRLEYIEIIQKRLEVLTELLNDLFEFSLILEGKTEELDSVNAYNVLADSLALFYEDFVKEGFEINVDLPITPLTVICGNESLKRIFQNILKNILVHASKKVHIYSKSESRCICFANDVTSSADIEAARLFDRFYKSDLSRKKTSTGLGLAIAKELASTMNGQISATLEDNMLIISLQF